MNTPGEARKPSYAELYELWEKAVDDNATLTALLDESTKALNEANAALEVLRGRTVSTETIDAWKWCVDCVPFRRQQPDGRCPKHR